MEEHTLTTPLAITGWRVGFLSLDWETERIEVRVRDSGGTARFKLYTGAVARGLIIGLNKADLSIKSLQRRILERMAADGELEPGNVTGNPD